MTALPRVASAIGRALMAAAIAVGAVWPAAAQFKIGQTSSFTGPVAAGVKEGTDGAKLYIDAINERGGIDGQKIEPMSLDDRFDPKLAAEHAKTLIEKGAVALFFNRGTPQSEAIMPVLERYRVPLIAPSTGAMLLRKPVPPGCSTCVPPTSARPTTRCATCTWWA